MIPGQMVPRLILPGPIVSGHMVPEPIVPEPIGKDATTSQTGLLNSVGPTGKQMHQLQNPMMTIGQQLGRVAHK